MPFNADAPKRIPGAARASGQRGEGEECGGGTPGVTGGVGRSVGVVVVVVVGPGLCVASGACVVGVGATDDGASGADPVGATATGPGAGAEGVGAGGLTVLAGPPRPFVGVLAPEPDEVNGRLVEDVVPVGSPVVGPSTRPAPPAATVRTATAARAPPVTPRAWSALDRPDRCGWAR